MTAVVGESDALRGVRPNIAFPCNSCKIYHLDSYLQTEKNVSGVTDCSLELSYADSPRAAVLIRCVLVEGSPFNENNQSKMVADNNGTPAHRARRFRHQAKAQAKTWTLECARGRVCSGLRGGSGRHMFGRDDGTVTIRKTEAIVSY